MNEVKQLEACLWSQASEQLSRAQLGASVPLCCQVQPLRGPRRLDFQVAPLSSRLGGSFRKFCKKAGRGTRTVRNAQARRRGRQSGSLALKNVRISETFKSTDFRDKILGRGSFLSLFRAPSNCFLMKMFDVCISLYLPC